MTKTEYLYGKDFDKQILKKQIEVCEYKLAKIGRLVKELLKVPYEARDEDRLREVLKARDWNERVFRESEEMLNGKEEA